MAHTPHISYASIRAEQQSSRDKLISWAWRNKDHIYACTASGFVGIILAGAAIISICLNTPTI